MRMETNGDYFIRTLESLKLPADERADTTRNATNIVRAVIDAFTGVRGGVVAATHTPASPVTGLVYGRIQSGKTRAMIASTALAFDNGFRISVVMTSNINDLVSQTHIDFTTGLPGVMTFTKDNDLNKEVRNVRTYLEQGDARLLVVCSKGAGSLENVSSFLRQVGGENHPAIIFDDEGDQASLDTNTRRRAQTGVRVAPSSINNIIQTRLRAALVRHVYVSVTGTPQAVLLQSADSSHRPSFIEMLPPGTSYIGGDHFFNTEEPEANPNHLIKVVGPDEKAELLSERMPVPNGLRRSLLFFLVSGASAILNRGVTDKGYSYLCHPSLRNNEQGRAEARIREFLDEVTTALLDANTADVLAELQVAHNDLRETLGDETPGFDEVKNCIRQQLATKRILVINALVKRQGIAYGRGLNFLIGGNTLGRGIAVKNLLVTYYIRDSRVSQIDTMHQHARMYGYRMETLAYTRLFIPRHLYYRFRDIHDSDKDLRDFIEAHRVELPTTFPIEYTEVLRTTRPSVLDVNNTETLRPKMHIFPNYVKVPQGQAVYNRMLKLLRDHFGLTTETEQQIGVVARAGAEITTAQAIELAIGTKTRSKNSWRDRTIAAVITKVADHYGDRVMLRFRTADRTVDDQGFFSTGALSGPELTESRESLIPTLWVMSVTTRDGSAVGPGQKFMYPTLVIPESFPKLVMFNRG